METKKEMYEATKIILEVWKKQKWLNYDEREPTPKEKVLGLFKIIEFKMPAKVTYRFELSEDKYKFWRTIKPSFVKGK